MWSVLAKMAPVAIKMGQEVATPLGRVAGREVARQLTHEIARHGRFVTITTVVDGVSKISCLALAGLAFLAGWTAKDVAERA